MSEFTARYKKLNKAQQQAVDTIDGPLLVIAGPGTGKTELLSMRTANILQKTDTLPENILCLTFTDSGATAMRERLASIIGPAAYKVAIHTFHSFGAEVINQHAEYFYHGAAFTPADTIASYEILRGIFDELDYNNPLASKLNGEYTHQADVQTVISELKRNGLTSEELLELISANEAVLDTVEPELTHVFSNRISMASLTKLAPLAQKVAALAPQPLPTAYTPLSHSLALAMAHAFDDAVTTNSTKPITAWRNEWLEKNASGEYVFKDRKRHLKLRAVSHIYFSYLSRMEQAGLYDFDDMVLGVIQGMETQPELRFNLQEKYQYIMVDEFQDTNLAQLRILFSLTNNPQPSHEPNVMAVGDDDQAIYSFQGAEVNNIHRYRQAYPSCKLVVLTDNYRSSAPILQHAREVITQGEARLEHTMQDLGLHKTLTPHATTKNSRVQLFAHQSPADEHAWLAKTIAQHIAAGQRPGSIAVLARTHRELIALLPYLHQQGIMVNYERRDNVLDNPVIQAIELLAQVVTSLQTGAYDVCDSLLPQLLAHPAFATPPELLWRVSLASYRNRLSWLETMATTPELIPVQQWLVQVAAQSSHTPLEHMIDELLGTPTVVGTEATAYVSPLLRHYFSSSAQQNNPEQYLEALEALRTIRGGLREYHSSNQLLLPDFLAYITMHRQIGIGITSVRRSSETAQQAIHLMTAHKAKGLEYDSVYIIGAIDSTWGERVRSRSRLVSYPKNLPLQPAGNTYSERLRLFFVAMTRAKKHLTISYSSSDNNGKPSLMASFLTGTTLTANIVSPTEAPAELQAQAELAWHDTVTRQPSPTMKQLLAPLLETYKLSATHLNNFIDISRGGPSTFLLHNLLRFPQAKSANASYGTAIHTTLQRAHNHLVATGERRPVEDILGDFTTELGRQRITPEDLRLFSKKGIDSLNAFLAHHYTSFSPSQKTELNFSNQGVVLGDARITGSLDLADVTKKTIAVTDYKTGKPSGSWKGSTDFEKIKLHKYQQQLMLYQLLCQHSRDFQHLEYLGGTLQFVEPSTDGRIHSLHTIASAEQLAQFTTLIQAVWRCITTLDFPDTSGYEPTYKGIVQFEADLVDKYS
ncbi:MAG: ATP-dependent DNA helicase [Candidatus Saccharimonas sp.]